MAENTLKKIIEKKIAKINNLKKNITIDSLKDKINENNSFINFKEKIESNIKLDKISIIAEINTQSDSKSMLSTIDNFSKNPKAYELYLKAKAIGPVVISDYKRQELLLKQSIKLDDSFAPSWELMGLALSRLSNFGVDVIKNKEKSLSHLTTDTKTMDFTRK